MRLLVGEDERDFAHTRARALGEEGFAVDLAGDGRLTLFVASNKGDRLFAFDAKAETFKDVTATRKLRSKSSAFAWGDFNGDARLDLASYDGTTLTGHAQQASRCRDLAHPRPGELVEQRT